MRSRDFYSYSDQHCVASGNKADTQMNEMEQRNQKEAQRIIQKGTKMHQWRMVFSKYVTGVTGYPEAIKKKKKKEPRPTSPTYIEISSKGLEDLNVKCKIIKQNIQDKVFESRVRPRALRLDTTTMVNKGKN